MSDTTAAATLSLEIDTGGAEGKLAHLADSYGLFKLALDGPAKSEGIAQVGQDAVKSETQVTSLTTQVKRLEAALAATDAAAKSSDGGFHKKISSAAIYIGLMEEQAEKERAYGYTQLAWQQNLLKEKLAAQVKFGDEFNALLAKQAKDADVWTYANLEWAQAKQQETNAAILASKIKSGVEQIRVTEKLAEEERAAVLSAATRSSVELVRISEQAAEAVRASQIKSGVEQIRITEQLAEEQRASVLASQTRSSVARIKIIEEEAEAVRASQIKSAVEQIRLTERLAEEERVAVIASQARSSVARIKIIEEEAEAVRASQIKSGVEKIRAQEQVAEQERQQIIRDSAKKLALEREYLLASDKQKIQGALNASKLMAGGYTGNLSQEFAPSVLAMAGPQNIAALEKQLAALSPTIANATAHQKKWNSTASEGHALARGLSGSLGQLWMTYGQIAPLLAGAALGAGFKSALQKGAEFEYQLTFVKALGGESAEAVTKLSDAALTLGQTSLKGPVELASGLRILAQAGLEAKDAISALPTVANLAVVGEMSMEAAAVTLVGVMHAFNKEITDMSHIGDVFAKAAALSQTSVEGMTQAMKTASVVGTQYGVNMEDAATAITLLAQVNIHGTAAGTSLRNMLKELYAPGKQAADVMKQLGISAKDAQSNLRPMADIIYDLKDKLKEYDKSSQVNILQKLFGERGAKEAIAMLQLTRKEWDSLREKIADSAGFMGQVASQLEMTTKGIFTQAKNTLEADLIGAFQKTDGAAHDLATSLRDLFASDKFKTDLDLLVGSMASLLEVVVKLAPALLYGAEAWAAWKIVTVLNVRLISLGGTLAGIAGGAAAVGSALAVVAGGLGTAATASIAMGTAMDLLGAAIVTFLGTPAVALIASLGGIYLAYKAWQDLTPDSVRAAERFTSAIDSQIAALKKSNDELERKIRLQATGSEVDIDASQQSLGKLRSERSNLKTIRSMDGNGADWLIERKISQLDSAILAEEAKIAEARKLQSKNDSLNLQQYAADQVKALEKIQVQAELHKKTIDTSIVQGLLAQLKDGLSGKDLLKVKTQIEEALVKARLAAGESGTKVFTPAEKASGRRDTIHAQIADINELQKALDDQYKAESESIKLRVQRHELSATQAADLQAELTLRQAINHATTAQNKSEVLAVSPDISKREKATAAGEATRLENDVANIYDTNYQRIETAHEQLMQRLDKQESALLGRQKSYVQQYASEWGKGTQNAADLQDAEARVEKTTATYALLKGTYSDAHDAYMLGEIEAAKSDVARIKGVQTLGEKFAASKDLAVAFDTQLITIQGQFAEIDNNYGDGLLGGLQKDSAKAAILSAQLDELNAKIAKGGDPASMLTAAKEKKDIEKLLKDAGKGTKTLIKDIEQGLTDALKAGFANGKFSGKSFIDSIRSQLKNAAFSITVSAIVDTVKGGISRVVSTALGGGSGGVSVGDVGGAYSLYNGVNAASATPFANLAADGYAGFATSGVGQSMGLSSTIGIDQNGQAVRTFTQAGGQWADAAASLGKVVDTYGPYANAVYQLTQGNYVQAAGSAVGAYIGNMILPGVGAWIGSYIGGMVGNTDRPAVDTGDQRYNYSAAGSIISQSSTYGSNKTVDEITTGLHAAYIQAAKDMGIGLAATSFRFATNSGANSSNPMADVYALAGSQSFRSGEVHATDSAAMQLAASRAVFTALKGSQLPGYLSKLFEGLTPATMTLEQISSVQAFAVQMKAVAEVLGSDKLSADMVKLQTNFGNLTSSLTSYLNAEGARIGLLNSLKTPDQKLTDAQASLAKAGIPETVAGLTTLVNGLDLTTVAGQNMLAKVISLKDAFDLVQPVLVDVAKTVAGIANERKGLQDQLDTVTMTPAQLVAKQRAAVDPKNVDVFDDIQTAENAAKLRTATSAYDQSLLEATGNASGLATFNRTLERSKLLLEGWTKDQIDTVFKAQDTAKTGAATSAYDQSLLEATGDTAGLKAFNRTLEKSQKLLEGWTEAQVTGLFAAQDNAEAVTKAKSDLTTAYDRESTALKNTIDSMGTFSKSIRSFAAGLLLGNLSPLTPAQKYAESKSQYEKALADSKSSDPLVAAAAQAKLQDAGTAFLTASQVSNASNDAYKADFAKVTGDMSATATWAEVQAQAATDTLATMKLQVTGLIDINDSVISVYDAIKALGVLGKTSTTPAASITASIQSGIENLYGSLLGRHSDTAGMDYWTGKAQSGVSLTQIAAYMQQSTEYQGLQTMRAGIEGLYANLLNRASDTAGMDYWLGVEKNGATLEQIAGWMKQSTEYQTINGSHANGLPYVPFDGYTAKLHKGERVLTSVEASNFRSGGQFSMTPLTDEIKALRAEVAALRAEQKEQTGALITSNYDANERAALKVANGAMEATKAQVWGNKSGAKIV